jgi:hypothetical protein
LAVAVSRKRRPKQTELTKREACVWFGDGLMEEAKAGVWAYEWNHEQWYNDAGQIGRWTRKMETENNERQRKKRRV